MIFHLGIEHLGDFQIFYFIYIHYDFYFMFACGFFVLKCENFHSE